MRTIILCILLAATCSEASYRKFKQRARKRNKRTSRQVNAVDGGWSTWSLYGLCNKQTCTESWARYCNNPRPRHGGKTCIGESIKKLPCTDTSQCKRDRPVLTVSPEEDIPVVAQWSRWGPCSVTCGVGTRSRTMLPCDDSHEVCETQDQPCVKVSCSTLNGFSAWSSWGECENCVQQRTRTCIRTDICGRQEETETQRCECAMDTATMTECQLALNVHAKFGGIGYRVECTEDGSYAPKQCDRTIEKCWCVEPKSGRQIFGTQHTHHLPIYDCDTLSQLSACEAQQHVARINVVASDYSPLCNEDGSYVTKQRSEEWGLQWCVYLDGYEIPGTRASLNADIDCDPLAGELTKCEATEGAECTKDGYFRQIQCFEDDQYEACHCVFADGRPKERTEIVKPGMPECSIYPDLTLTKCRATSLVSSTVTCLPSGEFAPEHCAQDICYCVDSDGVILSGSGSPREATRRTSCEDLIKMESKEKERKEKAKPVTFTPIFTRNVPEVTTKSTYSTASAPLNTEQTFYTGGDFRTPSFFPDIYSVTSSPMQLDELNYLEYSEWSEWSDCTVDCGGGYRSASRVCPESGYACGGPDVGQRWDECNDIPCVEAVIEELEYVWSSDGSEVTVTCRATGLPLPDVVIRNVTGYISADDMVEEGGQAVVRYVISPTVDTTLSCIATGEAQARRTIVVAVQDGEVSSFSSSANAIYLGQDITLECGVSGLPRPDIQLFQEATLIESVSGSSELRVSLTPQLTTTYSCSAVTTGDVIETQHLTVVVVDPCLGVQCQEFSSCHVEDDGNTTCVCDSCSSSDLDSVSLVCASNCETYLNRCEMNKAACLAAASLTTIYEGSCHEIPAPEISSECGLTRVVEGSDLTLTCSTTASWQEVTWYNWEGKKVGQGKRLAILGISIGESGNYTCEVETCGGSDAFTCPVVVEKHNYEECSQYGAGHFHQFSGSYFNYPGVCHYVLAMDCYYGSFYIYTGTSECGTEKIPLAYASSVTVFVGRDAVVLLRGFDVNEFGVMKHLRPGESLTYQNFLISRKMDVMHLTHPNTNFTLSWDGLTAISLTMDKSYKGKLCGLCGDVGQENRNAVEDAQSHGSSYEVDRYDRCNVADVPENTCSTDQEYSDAQTTCRASLYSEILSKCHRIVPVEEYMNSCIFDTCGVGWLSFYNTGLCNVLNAYALACEDNGVAIAGWRDSTPCPRQLMHKIAYMSKKRRRRKRSIGYSEYDIMMGGD